MIQIKRNTEFRDVVVMYVLQRDGKRLCKSKSMLRGISYPCHKAVSQESLPRECVLRAVPLPQGPGQRTATSVDPRPRRDRPRLFRGVLMEMIQPLAGSRVFKFYSPIMTGFSDAYCQRVSKWLPMWAWARDAAFEVAKGE